MHPQQVTSHPQERVIRGQLGQPRPGSGPQDDKVLQQLPKARHGLLLHLLQLSSGLLLPLLLLKLRRCLPALLNLGLVLLLLKREGLGLQQIRDKQLVLRDPRQLLLRGLRAACCAAAYPLGLLPCDPSP